MHGEARDFTLFVKAAFPDSFRGGKRVLDVGAGDINGNNRFLFDECEYDGNDVVAAPNVTVVARTKDLPFADATFDTIISTECFEHDPEYADSFRTIYRLLKPNGLFCFSCASTGRREHGTRRTSPHDSYGTVAQLEDMSDYYKNLTIRDVAAVVHLETVFSSWRSFYNSHSCDLYFYGFKKGPSPLPPPSPVPFDAPGVVETTHTTTTAATLKLDVVIPAIGEPHFDDKLELLRNNVRALTRCSNSIVVSIHCFLYTASATALQRLLGVLTDAVPPERIVLHMEPGYLGCFIYRYIQPASMQQRFDYIMFMLDDIELPADFDVAEWIACYTRYELDVLSPSVAAGSPSQDIMKKRVDVDAAEMRDVDFCEFFCYLMTPAAYATYYTLLDENTRTLWGVDLLMHARGLRMGIHNNVEMVHRYTRQGTGGYSLADAEEEMRALLQKHANTLQPVYSNQTRVLASRTIPRREIF
jgi:hypothetical protein